MVMLTFNEEQNLKQIQSLKNARIKNDYNQNLLNKRKDEIKRQAKQLRRFASLKSGSVAVYCLEVAELLESKI